MSFENLEKPIVAGLLCALVSACAVTAEEPGAPAQPAASETASREADAIVEVRYRYGDLELVAAFRETAEGFELVPGPDDAAISELLNQPSAGVAEDPSQPGLFHVYTNPEEQAAVQEALRNAPRKVIVEDEPEAPAQPGVRAQSLCADPAGCNSPCPVYGSYADLFRDANYSGQVVWAGYDPSLAQYGFNDAASSLYVQNGQVTLYEHANFGGRSITFVPDIEVRQSNGCGYSFASIPSLKRYTMISRWYWTDTSWNDQASSSFFYGY